MSDTDDSSMRRASQSLDVPPGLEGATALVTGGGGFVGSHIAHALAPSCEVTVLDDFTTGDSAAVPVEATVVQGDVRDVATLDPLVAEADVVFHQAALVDVDRSVRAPVETHGRNATGTVEVLDAARRGDTRVVLASSAAVYGSPESVPVHETDPKRPTSPYGVAKLAADRYARVYADRYGLETASLRYFNVYGPGASGGVVDVFLRKARAGDPLVLHGGGRQTRDFVHVSDVVRANLQAAVTDQTGHAYNIGTGDAVTVREVAERVLEATDSTSETLVGERRSGDIDRSCAAIERAREDLGYEPRVGLGAGVRSLVDGPRAPDDGPHDDAMTTL